MQNGQYDARLAETGAHVHTHVHHGELPHAGMERKQTRAELSRAPSPRGCAKKAEAQASQEVNLH